MNQTAIGSYIAKKRRPQNLTQEQLSVAEILAGVWIIGKQVLHKSFLHLYTQKEPLPRPIRASTEAPRLFSDIGVRGEIGTYFRSNSEIIWGNDSLSHVYAPVGLSRCIHALAGLCERVLSCSPTGKSTLASWG